MTPEMNMSKSEPSNWDKYRANEHKAKTGGNYRQHANGKGDINRSTHLNTYQLGSQLWDLAESHGIDSPEYKSCYAAWKAACNKAAGL